GVYGPTHAALDNTKSPLQLFFFFIPPRFNKFYNQRLNERVDWMHANKVSQGDEPTREEVLLQATKRHKKIKAEEILHCIGLLVARMLCPHKRRFAVHWAKTAVGAVSKGTFGRFMSKKRFGHVMQNRTFTDNTNT
ncbi:hypothetical protein PHMEG_00012503, partial [Phytophthora megakarya]